MSVAGSQRVVARCTGRVFADKAYYLAPVPSRPCHQHQRRLASDKSQPASSKSNPILEEYKRRKAAEEARNPTPKHVAGTQPIAPRAGDIDRTSIFEDVEPSSTAGEDDAKSARQEEQGGSERDPTILAAVLNPNPVQRQRWETRKVIQLVKRRGRLSRQQFVKRTEREHLVRSHNMKTSVKKLGMLARQIAGKRIDDAIVQMRFSKKKVAQEVLAQLEFARDEAIVMRGMGMSLNDMTLADSPSLSSDEADVSSTAVRAKPLDIQLKSGQRHTVTSLSDIYIDQAWVGRGPYGKLPDYRARGRTYIMRTPWTSLSVVLKEEATRVREHNEREEKRKKQRTGDRVWQQLPDRPITTQNAWYSW